MPKGVSDVPTRHDVILNCPKCKQVFITSADRLTMIDGAYFGTSFPHLVFMVHPELRPLPLPKNESYENRIHGFKVHPKGYGMKWEEIREKNMKPDEREARKEEWKQTAVTLEPLKHVKISPQQSLKNHYGKIRSKAVATVEPNPIPARKKQVRASRTTRPGAPRSRTLTASRITFPVSKYKLSARRPYRPLYRSYKASIPV